MKIAVRKIALWVLGGVLVFASGFFGGVLLGRSGILLGTASARQESTQAVSHPLMDLGEFKLSLPGDQVSGGALVSFELALEIQDRKIAGQLASDEYWKVLFRNEVIEESLAQKASAFRNTEGLLRASEAIAGRLNRIAPRFRGQPVIRRVLFKSFILQ
ncbi:MAG: flagellar basal body-associated protein FliL [Synergistales bacterium]